MSELVSIFKNEEDPHQAYLDALLPSLKENGFGDRDAIAAELSQQDDPQSDENIRIVAL